MSAPDNTQTAEVLSFPARVAVPPGLLDAITAQIRAELREEFEDRIATLEAQSRGVGRVMDMRAAADYVGVPFGTFKMEPHRWGGVKTGKTWRFDRHKLDRLIDEMYQG